jgi:hypothetical protein
VLADETWLPWRCSGVSGLTKVIILPHERRANGKLFCRIEIVEILLKAVHGAGLGLALAEKHIVVRMRRPIPRPTSFFRMTGYPEAIQLDE